jgi:hypothetical protein
MGEYEVTIPFWFILYIIYISPHCLSYSAPTPPHTKQL